MHTPQDVFVAIFLSVLSLICTAKLMAYLDRHPEREDWFLLGRAMQLDPPEALKS